MNHPRYKCVKESVTYLRREISLRIYLWHCRYFPGLNLQNGQANNRSSPLERVSRRARVFGRSSPWLCSPSSRSCRFLDFPVVFLDSLSFTLCDFEGHAAESVVFRPRNNDMRFQELSQPHDRALPALASSNIRSLHFASPKAADSR
jgi:hypothetical protein